MRTSQIGLKTFLVAACLSGAAIGGILRYGRGVVAQRRIVTALEARGARLVYDVNRGFLGQPEVCWLKQIHGEDWFYQVESVAFYDRPCGREELELIARLPDVRELMLLESDLDDADLACLVSLESLNRLRVSGSPLGDEALRILAESPNLRDLMIEGGRITPGCLLAELSRFQQLESLAIQRTCLAPSTVVALRRALAECQIVVDECSAVASPDDPAAFAMRPITAGR